MTEQIDELGISIFIPIRNLLLLQIKQKIASDCPKGYKPFTVNGVRTCLHLYYREVWIDNLVQKKNCDKKEGTPILPRNSGP